MMKELNIRQVRQSLSHLDRLLEAEGEVIITRRGKAVGRVVSVGKKRPMPSHRDLRMEMVRLRRKSERLIREERDAK
jgi:antitoxin (DNA-binding transcriptional repressor) of toxin-antitoxin stability system